MPKLNNINRLPKKCRDKNRAFSWYKGKRIYHGTWGTLEADQNYKRFLDRLRENPDQPVWNEGNPGNREALIAELTVAFLKYHTPRLHKSHVLHFKNAISYLVEMYGELTVDEFSPKKLKACRDQMVKTGRLCRGMVNDYTRRIVQIFSWGCGEEITDPTILAALREVKALRKGEPGTFDHPPRQAVPDDVIRRTLPFTSPVVRAMVVLQRLIGCRPRRNLRNDRWGHY